MENIKNMSFITADNIYIMQIKKKTWTKEGTLWCTSLDT